VITVKKDKILKLRKLSWIINNECNLGCIHCYPNSDACKKRLLSKAELGKIYDGLKNVRFDKVFLSGGEPLLDSQLVEHINIARKISNHICVCTNGTLLTADIVTRLIVAGVKGVVISLHAVDDEICTKIYGSKNVMQSVISALKLVLNQDIEVSVEMTIMRQNSHIILDYIKHLKSLGVKSFSFKRLMPVGRATCSDIALTPEENYKVLQQIFSESLANYDVSINVHDPLYGIIVSEHFRSRTDVKNHDRLMTGYSCRAGTRWIGINPKGDVSPCPLMLYQGISIGNINDKPLKEIIDNSELMKKFKSKEESSYACSKCRFRQYCSGCKVASYANANEMFSKDPMCPFADEHLACKQKEGA